MTPDELAAFGDRVREMRQSLDLTVRDLANELDISPPKLAGIERARSFDPRSIERLRQWFDQPTD